MYMQFDVVAGIVHDVHTCVGGSRMFFCIAACSPVTCCLMLCYAQ